MTKLKKFLETENIPSNLAEGVLSISEACIQIRKLTDQGSLAGIYGAADNVNIQGEEQQKLDIVSNNILIEKLSKSEIFAAFASEELESFSPTTHVDADYLCLFDPLDGSGNIDLNLSIGTIFSVLKKQNKVVTESDFLQQGTNQLVSGYVMYGASTVLVLTFGEKVKKNSKVSMFSFDENKNDFILIESSIKQPTGKSLYSINQSNYRYWHPPMQRYIGECIEGKDGVREKDFNMRWMGCMVGDCHKTLLKGGIFSYPAETKNPDRPAKLRLMYEVNPISLIFYNAGGLSTTGTDCVLNIKPHELHQRVPVILGDKDEIERIEKYHGE